MSRFVSAVTVGGALALSFAGPAGAQLNIHPTFDASITGSAQAALIEADINSTVANYKSLFSDPITVNILFRYATTAPNGTSLSAGLLSRSNYVIYAPLWATFDNALVADEKTPNDETADTFLPAAPLARDIEYSSANGRAVGLNAPGTMTATSSVGGGTFDGIVTLNANQPFDFDRTDGIGVGKYDAVRMLEHEIDEVLGLGSILPSTTDFRGGTALRPEDLFRYAAAGTRSLTTSSSASAYFSIDGGQTDIIAFNQAGSGDYGDWQSPACATPHPEFAQYAFTCRGGTANVNYGSPEAIALDVIGYDLVSPEPSTLVLAITGVGAMIVIMRRRRSSVSSSRLM